MAAPPHAPLGCRIARGCAPLEDAIDCEGLRIAEEWGRVWPLVQHLRATQPVVRRLREARVEWVVARLGPLSCLERRAREITRGLEGVEPWLEKEVQALLKRWARERKRRRV